MFEIINEIISHRIPSVNILYEIRDVFLPTRRVGIVIILWTRLRVSTRMPAILTEVS
jgi:hypothetical protein